jgi:beta-fructofuranosidase
MGYARRTFLAQLGVSGAALGLRWPTSLLRGTDEFDELVSQATLAADPLRPQFHLLPARNWMNDPNGPIYWKGQYHMFFQYNPSSAVWGDMHWAHAASPDMIHWKQRPGALAPTSGGYDSEGCFSGSAVDNSGTATFLYTGVKSVSPEQATLRDGTHNFREVQCLATSDDSGLRVWNKLAAPVLQPPNDPNITGFRDPCLWRDEKHWYMGVGSGQRGLGGKVLVYRSTNLRQWEYLHPLASGQKNSKVTSDPVNSGEMWECPDFFALGKKYVLLYSTERKVYWQTGEYDAKEIGFRAQKRGMLDYGSFYAPKSQLDAKGRRILWGWIPETRPEAEFRVAGWAGCMSLPRELTVDDDGQLGIRVVPELQTLRGAEISLPSLTEIEHDRHATLARLQLAGATAEIELRFRARSFHLKLGDRRNDLISISYDPARSHRELQIGNEYASLPAFAGSETQLNIFLDGSVVEAMIDGRAAWTTRTYQTLTGALHFEVPIAEMDALASLRAWPVRPISSDRLTT